MPMMPNMKNWALDNERRIPVFMVIVFLIPFLQMNCMCLMHMTHGQHENGEASLGEVLSMLRNDELAILIRSPDYPFYAGQAFSIEVFIKESRTSEPVNGAKVAFRTASRKESKSADAYEESAEMKSVTDKEGISRFQFHFEEAATFDFNVVVDVSGKLYNLSFTQDLLDASHLKHDASHSDTKLFYGIIGSSAMILMMTLIMTGI